MQGSDAVLLKLKQSCSTASVPFFLSFTQQQSPQDRMRLAKAVSLTVFAVLACAALFGESLLQLIAASLPAFRVGGALHLASLVVCIGLVALMTWLVLAVGTRILGLFVAAMAIQTMADGMRSLFPVLNG
ncbi:MAG: hypothetical protein EBT41_11050 [Betaproteobacteria bacterium]|nr:hypothetical protein [Betaproteobacteria bacterium]